jgi:hypothetical protein
MPAFSSRSAFSPSLTARSRFSGVGVEVLAEGTGSTGLESSFLYGYGVAPSPGA